MSFGLGSLAGIGLSLYGGRQQKKAQERANRGNLAAKNAARKEIIGGRDAYLRESGLGLASYLDMLKEAGAGEARAAGEITRGTSAAARGIMDQNRQGMASLAGAFAGSGLYGSSLLQQGRLGQQRATGRQLTDLQGSSAMARAQLARGSSAAKMGAMSQIGAFQERRASTLYDAGTQLANLEAGVQHVADPGISSMYGQLGGLLAGGVDDLWSSLFGGEDDE